ncbi:MAG: CNNM domain-containing protein, partial [Treponema sp.]|nr:CNNM domain-containing protein [Treponema sp.]
MEDPLPRLLILAALVTASAFLSFAGSVLSQVRKSRLKLFFAGGKSGREGNSVRIPEWTRFQKSVFEASENPGPFLFALNIWNLLLRLFAGFLLFFPAGTAAFRSAVSSLSAGASGDFPAVFGIFSQALPVLIFPAIVFIVFSELLPAALAPKKPERALVFLFPAVWLLGLPWKPLYRVAARFSSAGPEEAGDEEFRMALEEGEKSGAVESRERSMVEGVLYLGDRPVSAFMTHRSEMEFLDISAGPEEAREKALAFRFQGFFPVVRETQDDVAGVVSVEDILIALTEKEWKGL